MESSPFVALDYVIVGVTMLCFASIGLYYRFSGGRQKTAEEYLLADRSMSIMPVAVSLMASFMSSIAMLGTSAEYYTHGIMFVLYQLCYFAVIPLTIYFYLPVFFGLQKMSTYEYLGLRFGQKLRIICSLTYTVQQIFYNAVVLYAPALTLEAVTGVSLTTSILVMGLVCTFYSTLGGVKAVVIADLFQTVLMYFAIWSVIGFAAAEVGGFGNMWNIATEGGRTKLFEFSFDPTIRHTFWNIVFGGIIITLSLYASNHTQIQRALTMKDLETAGKCLWLSTVFQATFSVSICVCAVAVYAVYHNCDPLADGKIAASDQILPYFVIDVMKKVPGMPGLFIAGIFSASLSTLSAGCNCLAAVTVGDYVPWAEKRYGIKWLSGTMALKMFAMGYGLVFSVMAFIVQYLGGIFQAIMSLYVVIGGPLLAVFTLGMFTTVAHELGTIIGLLCGITLSAVLTNGGPRPKVASLPVSSEGCPGFNISMSNHSTSYGSEAVIDDEEYFYFYRISYMWVSLIGFLTVFAVSYVMSLVVRCKRPWELEKESCKIGEEGSEGLPDPALFAPFFAAKVRRRNKLIISNRKIKMELLPLHVKETESLQ